MKQRSNLSGLEYMIGYTPDTWLVIGTPLAIWQYSEKEYDLEIIKQGLSPEQEISWQQWLYVTSQISQRSYPSLEAAYVALSTALREHPL